ncbi:MAG: hypothetical protein AAFN30_17855, partial [Actinomycetota bacterium]
NGELVGLEAPGDIEESGNGYGHGYPLGQVTARLPSVDELATALARSSGPRLIDARINPAPYPHLLQVTRG